MATVTPNYNLRKPSNQDQVNVTTDIANSMDTIDGVMATQGAAIATETAARIAAISALNGTLVPVLTTQTSEADTTLLFSIQPVTAGSAPFGLYEKGGANSPAGHGVNHGVWIGWNPQVHFNEPGSVAGQPMVSMGFEDGFWDTSTSELGSEWYVEYNSPDHTSVQLFRPFYARMGRDDNADHHAYIHMDIGTDGVGSLTVWAGLELGGAALFAITPTQVQSTKPVYVTGATITLDPPSGQANLYLKGVSQQSVVFSRAGVQGWILQQALATSFIVYDKDVRAQATFTYGATAAAAITELASTVSINTAAPVLQFRLAGAAGWDMVAPTVDTFVVRDKDARTNLIFTYGTTALLAQAQFVATLSVTGASITINPASGAANLYIQSVAQQSVVFNKSGTQGWILQQASTTSFIMYDKDVRAHVTYTYGATAAAATTAFGSSVSIAGKVGFNGTTPITKPAATPADATDLATALTLLNYLKNSVVIAYGLAA